MNSKSRMYMALLACASLAGASLPATAGNDVRPAKQSVQRVIPAYMVPGSGPLTPGQRGLIAREFVNRWGGYFVQTYNQPLNRWAVKQGVVIAKADPDNLRRAMQKNTLEAAVMTMRGQEISDDKAIDFIASREMNGVAGPMVLGDLAADLVYTPLPPCRIFDTRSVGGAIPSGSTRSFDTYPYTGGNFSYQGGTAAGNCGMPADAAAVVLNVAAPLSTVGGFLTVYPYGTTRPLASNLDYSAGELKNNEIIAKSANSLYDITVYAHGSTQVVGDVVGYYIRPQATALDCVDLAGTSVAVPVGPNTFRTATSPACAVGYTQVALNCDTGSFNSILAGQRASSRSCFFTNQSASTYSVTATTRCCRVPGR